MTCKHLEADGSCNQGVLVKFAGRPDHVVTHPSSGFCRLQCKLYDGPRDIRPPITAGNVLTAAQAILTAKRVNLDVLQARIAACDSCDQQKTDASGAAFCGMCGCSLSGDSRKVVNLAAYEENLPKWGCKHPDRASGKGWAIG